jgi:hypothetical protein
MLLVGSLPDSDLEFALSAVAGTAQACALISTCSINTKRIALVAVVPLIERSHEADAGLDSHDTARPRDFIHACLRPCPQSLLDSSIFRRTRWTRETRSSK